MKLAVESDHPVTEIARDLGVKLNTLHTWIGKYHRPRASGKAEKNDEHACDDFKRLRKEVAKLKDEHTILKKWRQPSLRETVSEIQVHQRLSKSFSIAAMCRVMSVSGTGYYEWLSPPESKRSQEDKAK